MSHLVRVDGIEMFATVRGHSLECDSCGERYDGGNDEDKGGPLMPCGYRELRPQMILEHGMRLGWTGLEKYKDPASVRGVAPPDLCPVCSAMKGAPYWPTVVEEPAGTAVLVYRRDGPLVQRFTVVRPLDRAPLGIDTEGWPVRDRYNEPPAVMELKVTASETVVQGIHFDSNVRWPSQQRGECFKEKAPRIRLWSWGDGKVYGKEVSQSR